jgi:RND family efflux transporter MFP subunit
MWCVPGAVLIAVVAAGCSRTSDAAPPGPSGPPPVPVQMTEVQPVKLREVSEYLGTLRSRRSVRIQPQAEGWITAIEVSSGAQVKRGALLMRIDARRQVAAVRTQEATRAARQADLVYWTQQVRRVELLSKGGGASRQELDQARSSLASAQAAASAQDQQLRAAAVELRYYDVSAPEAGTVGDVPVRIGDLVTAQSLLTTIDHNEVLEAYISVPVERARRLRPGMPVEIVPQAVGAPSPSRISFIAPQVSPDQTVLVKSWIDNRAGGLRNAELVRARLIWSERAGPAVPVLAVQMQNGQTFVWVADRTPEGTLVARQRAVQLGAIDGQHYPVLSGLSLGDRVIVSGVQKLRPGAPVVAAPAERGRSR